MVCIKPMITLAILGTSFVASQPVQDGLETRQTGCDAKSAAENPEAFNATSIDEINLDNPGVETVYEGGAPNDAISAIKENLHGSVANLVIANAPKLVIIVTILMPPVSYCALKVVN
ncbi:hypothetical protein PISL3812_04495 [Talaromyces islandicus]|uniref:Uncharacterized protein n=1 Tax=Talaromyces islandicus TaxID=28573 RepID=A0A0U1LVP4_TALIS|nr:hypothetical protein PISL3812_04495 [Talaromyces islandicus]